MIYSPFRLDGKTILITGASSGIGRAVAIECSRLGASCCVLVSRNKEALEETASMMDSECNSVICVCDLSNAKAIEVMVKKLDILDGVVSNAGINKMSLMQFYSEKDLDKIFTVNCFSPMMLMRQLVKRKKLKTSSSVVFVASIAGYSNITPGNGMYGASKSALSAYVKYVALELVSKKIRCNTVHPGMVDTPLIHNGVIDDSTIKADLKRYPLGRYGVPKEIAWSIIYLLSDASSWMTGTDLVIDGGRSLV